MRRPCSYCGRPLVYAPIQGWVHIDGGGTYWQRCGDCGWEGSGVGISSCPSCGGTRHLLDDHCALPDMTEEPIPVSQWTELEARDESLLASDPGPPEVVHPHPFHGGEIFIERCVQCGGELGDPLHRREAMEVAMRRCPDCDGWWIRTMHGFEHNVGCPRKPEGGWLKERRDQSAEPEPYPEAEQDCDEAEARDETVPKPMWGDPGPDCPCEGCEDARRAALVKAYPELRRVGLSPKEELDL